MTAEFVASPALTVSHGFFTRRGGVSSGPFASLNCSLSGLDAPEHVLENRARAARALGATPDALVGLTQVHGDRTVVVTPAWSPGDGPRADAAVTARLGIALGIVTADCAPVLFADRTAGVVWGDARVGNIIFGDDLSVAALLDWEGATTGPPEIDVAWWVMFDEFLCEAQGIQRLEGVAGRDETLARYEALGGRRLSNIVYYEILAGLVLSLINSRLADLLVSGGVVDPTFGAEIVTRITDLTARRLATV